MAWYRAGVGRLLHVGRLYRFEGFFLLALSPVLEVHLVVAQLAGVLITVVPSFPPLSDLTAPITDYLLPEVLRFSEFVAGVMLVFAVVKRMTAK